MSRWRSTLRIESLVAWCVIALAVLALGAVMCWPVVEKDVFLFIRLGREILATGRLPDREIWSSTAQGAPYTHYQWLSSVIFALADEGGPRALPLLRAALVALGMAGVAGLVVFSACRCGTALHRVRELSAGESAAAAAVFLLVSPVLLVIAQERLLLRPDLLTHSLCLVPLVALAASPARVSIKIFGAAVILVLWTNLHGGTAPFGVVVAAILIGGDQGLSRWRVRLATVVLFAACWLASPIGGRVASAFWQNAVEADWAALGNLDYRALTPALFIERGEGLTYPAWALFALVGIAACLRRAEPDRRALLFLGAGLVFLGLSVYRIRLRAYCAILFTPPICEGVLEWCAAGAPVAGGGVGFRLGRRAAIAAAAAVAWAGVLGAQVAWAMPSRGFGVSSQALPVRAAEYLAHVEPAPLPELFNESDYGGYLLYALRGRFRVSSDGRALPYVEFLRELNAVSSPDEFQAMLLRHRFNLALVRPSWPRHLPNGQIVDPLAALFPRETWALLFFDNAGAVLARRGPENRALIERDEIRELLRGRAATYPMDTPGLASAQVAAFYAEVNRCLERCPDCVYCLQAEAARLEAAGDSSKANETLLRAKKAAQGL